TELRFTDENGQKITLGDCFKSGKPVVLQLGYYGCPMLCGLVMNGLADAMKDMDWAPGREFEVVSVSIDPAESPTLARLKKTNFLTALGTPEAAYGWRFLTGAQSEIRLLAESVGFRYRWDATQQQFAHAAALMILTPDGRVSRYLYGIKYPQQTLRLSL